MTQVHGEASLSAQIDANPDRVWSILRRFSAVAEWSPIARTSRLVSGEDGAPGAERELVTVDGTTVCEQLLALDDGLRWLRYRMLSFPIPVTEQENEIKVEPVGLGGGSRITFSARFVPAMGVAPAAIAAINVEAFDAAAAGIDRYLKGRPDDGG